MKEKAAVVDKNAIDHLDVTVDVDIMDNDKKYFPPHPKSPLLSKYY